jgi:virginiamycin B lyase
MTPRRGLAAAVALLLAALPAAVGDAAPAGTVTRIPLNTGGQPQMVVTGPDGNLWVAVNGNAPGIARVTPSGVVRFFPTAAGTSPNWITVGPDGALWFDDQNNPQIGRITTSGKITEFPVPGVVVSLVAGSDGNIWASSSGTAKIFRVTPTGTVTTLTPPSAPTIITRGPDGAVWYSSLAGGNIGRVTPSGTFTTFPAPGPTYLTFGRDGAIWFTSTATRGINHMTTSGTLTNFQTQSGGGGVSLTLGPDGLVWYTSSTITTIGRMDLGGQNADFGVGINGNQGVLGAGPDDAVYVPDVSGDALVRVDAGSPDPALGKSVTAAPLSGNVLVKPPGSNAFAPLSPGQSLPVGTIVDVRNGRVRIYATSGGHTYSADFYEGEFQIEQLAKKGATTDLKLVGGNFKGCPKPAQGGAAKKPKTIRHLWGSGSGPFRTIGRFAAATVRGTTWLTADECRATLVRVTTGAVTVRDLVKRRNVVVRAGHQYLARG